MKYTIDEYDHFLYVLAAESVCDNHFSPTYLDLAVQIVEIFAFLLKIKKQNFEQKWNITILWMFFNVFMDKESEKNIIMNLSCLFIDILEIIIFKQNFL